MVQLLLGLTLVVSVVSVAWPSELPTPSTFHAGTTETAITANFSKQDGDNGNFSRTVDNDNDSTASIVGDPIASVVRDSTASIEKGPTASIEKSPTASMVRDSTASIEKGPTTSIEKSPTASMVRDSTTSMVRDSTTSMVRDSTASIEKSPTTSIEKGPNASIQKGPTASMVRDSTTSMVRDSTASIEKGPTASIENGPTASMVRDSTTSIEKGPTASIEKGPTTSIEKGPTTSIEKGPTTSIEKGPTTSIEKGPTASMVRDSTASIEKGPTASIEKGPTTSIEKGPTASMVRDSTASIEKGPTASIEKGSIASMVRDSTASMVRDSTASMVRDDQDLEAIVGSQTQKNSGFEILANQRGIQKENYKESSEITISRAWRKMHPTEDLNYDLITPSSVELSDSPPDATSRNNERLEDELSEKREISINSQMIHKSPELANSKEFSSLLPSSTSILPQEIKDVLDEPPDEIPTASVLSLQIETPLGRLREDVRTSSYGFLQREIPPVSSVDRLPSTSSTDEAQFAESVDPVKSTPSADKTYSYLSKNQTQSAAAVEHSRNFPFPVTGNKESSLMQRNNEKRKGHLLMLKDSLKDDIFNSSSQRKALERQGKNSKVSTLNPVLHLVAQMEEPNDFPQTTPLSVFDPSKQRIKSTVVSSKKEEDSLKYGKVIKMLSASKLVAKQTLVDKAGLSLTPPTPEKPSDRALNASRDERTSLLASKEDGDDTTEHWRMEDVDSSDLSLVTNEDEKIAMSSVSKGDAKMSKDGMQRSASYSASAEPTDSSFDERDEMANPSSHKPEYRTSRGDVLVLNLSSVEAEQKMKLNPSKIPLLRSSIFLSAPREKEIATLTRDAQRNIRKISSKSISSPSTELRDETVGDDTRFSVLSNVGSISQMFGDDSRMTRLADTMFRDDVPTPDVTSPPPTLKSEIVLTTKTAILKPTQKSQIAKPRPAVSKGTNKTQPLVKKPAQQPTTKDTTGSAPKTVKASATVKKPAPKVIVKKQPEGDTLPVKDYKGYRDKNKTTKSVTLVTSPTEPQKVNSSVSEVTPSQKRYESKKLSAPESKCDGQSPPHVLIEKHGVYEVRVYPLSMWLSVNVITNNRILAELEAANKLQKYFNGDNEKGLELNKTCPVLTQIKFQDYSEFKEKVNEYAVSFYVPTDGSTDMPAPNDSEVLVDTVEERTIYVYSFRARVWEMTDSFLQAEAKKLSSSLRSQGEPFLSKYFYVASYATSRMSTNYVDYELWMYATRFRVHDVTKVKESLSDQPLNDVTRRTRSRVCKGFECPKFEVLALHKSGIQKRRYYGARFATYVPEFCEFTKSGIWKAFMPLHLYKHGVNSHFEVIGSTRPAGVVHVRETGGSDVLDNSSCSHTFTVSLYLPKRLHAAPPTAGPAAPRVKITELNDAIVYVQAVGGFLLVPERIQKEVDNFRQRLVEQNLCFRSDEYYLVVYDYITRFHGRLNEIWLIADRCPDSL